MHSGAHFNLETFVKDRLLGRTLWRLPQPALTTRASPMRGAKGLTPTPTHVVPRP